MNINWSSQSRCIWYLLAGELVGNSAQSVLYKMFFPYRLDPDFVAVRSIAVHMLLMEGILHQLIGIVVFYIPGGAGFVASTETHSI